MIVFERQMAAEEKSSENDNLTSRSIMKEMSVRRLVFLIITLVGGTGLTSAEDNARLKDLDSVSPTTRTIPAWLQRLARRNERSNATVTNAFRAVVKTSSKSTVRVYCDGVHKSLGAVVDQRGYIVTKASELKGTITCELSGGSTIPAQVIGVRSDYDIALLKVEVTELQVVRWDFQVPDLGSWLATSGTSDRPVAIGVMSASPHRINGSRGVLGILLRESPAGAKVTEVVAGGAAEKAGVGVGDMVVSFNGEAVSKVDRLIAKIREMRSGDVVHLVVRRNGQDLKVMTRLTTLRTAEQRRAEMQRTLGRQVSDRSGGFPRALQHDSVLRPSDCGGPLVNLDGKAIGINIASADRVASFAIPAQEVLMILGDLLPKNIEIPSSIEAISTPVAPSFSLTEQ